MHTNLINAAAGPETLGKPTTRKEQAEESDGGA